MKKRQTSIDSLTKEERIALAERKNQVLLSYQIRNEYPMNLFQLKSTFTNMIKA